MPKADKPKIIRITTTDMALSILLKGQLAYLSNDFDIIGVCSSGPGVDVVREREGVPVYTLEMTRQITPFKDLLALIKLVKLFRQLKPDCVHSHTPKAGILGMFAAWIARVPHRFHTVAGIPWLDQPKNKRRMLLRWVECYTYRFANGVFPNSFGLLARMREEKLFRKADRVEVLGPGSSNGIDVTHFSETEDLTHQGQSIRKSLGLSDDTFLLCFVGRVVQDKGISELLDAINQLDDANIHLMVVGDQEGTLNAISERHRNLLETLPQCHAVGFQKDVRPYIVASQALVLPSYREGFPNVVMQSLALGRPAIVSNINGCNELVKDEENGLILHQITPEALVTSVSTLVNDKVSYQKMKTAARPSVMPYKRENIWNCLKALYEEVLG